MSKKIMFNALYKLNGDGERIEIPALQGPAYNDTAVKADIKTLKSNMNNVRNATSTPVPSGKVWGSTATGAGWVDFAGSDGEYKTVEIYLGWNTQMVDVSLEYPSGDVYVALTTQPGANGNIMVEYLNGETVVDTMSVLSAVTSSPRMFYTHYKRIGDLYVSQKTSAATGTDANVSVYTHPLNPNGANITSLKISSSSTIPVGTKIQVAYKV